MNLQTFLSSTLREHAGLVAAGIPSAQALNIVTGPMVSENLHMVLLQLTTIQRDRLIDLLQENSYEIGNGMCQVDGIFASNGQFVFEFTSLNIGDENSTLGLIELPNDLIDDITAAVRIIV